MSAFEIIPGDPSSSVVLHVPHASTWIPDEVRAGIVLNDKELAADVKAITDADTDLTAEVAARLRYESARRCGYRDQAVKRSA